jgi:hypothetical protein
MSSPPMGTRYVEDMRYEREAERDLNVHTHTHSIARAQQVTDWSR